MFFSTRKQQSISGKETAIAEWSAPLFQWTLLYNVLRQGNVDGVGYTDFSQLMGFYSQRFGGFDSFLYKDEDDNAVVNQPIAIADGATTTFRMIRTFGGFAQRTLAVNFTVAPIIYNNGVVVNPTNYTISSWGGNGPGILTFTSAPMAGNSITSTFQYYWPCRFAADTLAFEKFLAGRYKLGQLAFRSIK